MVVPETTFSIITVWIHFSGYGSRCCCWRSEKNEDAI